MRSKYFTSAISAVLYLTATQLLPAQTPKATPVPGYVRFWNMLPPADGAFDLRKVGAPTTETPLISNATAYRYSSYEALPIGRYRLGVYRTHDEKTPLKVLDLNVTPNSFFTVLISPGAINLINDTIDPKVTSRTVTVRNYFPGITVAVSAGGKVVAPALAYGQSYEADDMASTNTSLKLQTQLPNGKPAEFTAEPDFRSSKRATVLIIPDSYGRFRPCVTVDGKNI